MVQAAVACNDNFEISRVDIDRPPPHYAVDTVRLLRRANPGAELVYLMGGDSLGDLTTWSRPSEFLAACDALGVMRRPGEDVDLTALERELPGLTSKTRFIDAPLLEISSTQIRRRAAEGHTFRYYLHPAVYEIIQEKRLYRP
jgi:nicotinate-nucleotide adenylyltransferase